MEDIKKVSLNAKSRQIGIVKISLIGTVSIIGLALSIYSIVTAKYLFAVWYFIAFILGLVYVVIKINTVFPTYLAVFGDRVIMSIWENGIMPYRLPDKPTFLSDFIPEKIKTDEILMDDIESIYIGSVKFFRKMLTDDKIPEKLLKTFEDKHLKNTVKRMYFMLVLAKDGEECFMSVTGFDWQGVSDILDIIERKSVGVQINTNVSKLIKIRKNIKKA